MSTVAQLITALAREFKPGDHVAILLPSAKDPGDIEGSTLMEICGLIGTDAPAITEEGATHVKVAALVFSQELSEAIQGMGNVSTEAMGVDEEPTP